MPYLLYVDDNFHYMDESERYLSGTFDTAEAALEKARHIVDKFLARAYEQGMRRGGVISLICGLR
jgi:hypothetical protein